jgi:hypothetical protein
MRAKNLIENASFDPAEVKMMAQVFDDVWSQIARTFVGDVDEARTRLADIVITLARSHTLNAGEVAIIALRRFREQ